MGAIEAFMIGGLAGAAGGLVVYFAWANAAKGRSSTAFPSAGRNSSHVLQIAHSYFLANGMRICPLREGIAGEEGSEWATGVRVLEVRARDHEGGADVRVDAYVRGFYPKEISVDPNATFGMVPRRKGFRLAQALVAALGAPNAVWQHRRG